MKHFCNIKMLLLAIPLVVVVIIMPVSAFSGGEPTKEEKSVDIDGLVICPEPRPQVCTMDYQPVCAQLQDGSFKVYSNGCGACSDHNVIGYREGECSTEK